MKTLHLAAAAGLAGIFCLGITKPALGQNINDLFGPQTKQAETSTAWKVTSRRRTSIDTADIGNSWDQYSYTVLISSENKAGTLAIDLACRISTTGYSGLLAAVQLNPNDHRDQPALKKMRTNTITGHLTIGGKRVTERWFFVGKRERFAPINTDVPRRLFNGAIRGDIVKVKVQGKTYEIDFPEPNGTFKSFAKFCPVTNGGKAVDPEIFRDWTDMTLSPDADGTI